ncbi:MAG: hypothetical protein ABR520_11215 [Mycobacteriales bacterium]|nr:hypothetical protein [Actinomycetota bacterium]
MKVYGLADLSPGSDDRAFVIATWSSSYKSSHFAGMIAAEDWATVMHAQIGKLLDRPDTRTLVARGGRDFLYGFIAGDPDLRVTLSEPAGGRRWVDVEYVGVVHYVYVKDAFRSEAHPDGSRGGPRIARGLLGALGIEPAQPFLYTCRTGVVARLQEKIPRARFAPAAARYTNYRDHQHEQR